MATLDVNDSGDIAKQIAFELNITRGQELEDAIVDWIPESRELAIRLERVLASDMEWNRLQERGRFGPAMAPEPAPIPGNRIKKLEASYKLEEKLLDMWAKRL